MQNQEQSEAINVNYDNWIEIEDVSIRQVRKEKDGERYFVTAECLTCETIDDTFCISTDVVKEEVEQPATDRLIAYGYRVGDGITQACSVACGAGRLIGYTISKTYSVIDWTFSTPTESV